MYRYRSLLRRAVVKNYVSQHQVKWRLQKLISKVLGALDELGALDRDSAELSSVSHHEVAIPACLLASLGAFVVLGFLPSFPCLPFPSAVPRSEPPAWWSSLVPFGFAFDCWR